MCRPFDHSHCSSAAETIYQTKHVKFALLQQIVNKFFSSYVNIILHFPILMHSPFFLSSLSSFPWLLSNGFVAWLER